MTRPNKLAALGVLFVLGACASPYGKLYEEVNAAKTSYNPGVNDQATYDTLKTMLGKTQEAAAKDAGKPKPTLAANFVSMTATDAMANVGEISSEEFAEAQVAARTYAESVKSSCASGLKSGIDELDGALCALSIATFHLNTSAFEPRKFEAALADEDWAKANEANDSFLGQVESEWSAIAGDIEALPEADQNKTPVERMAFYRICQMQKAQESADGTNFLSDGLAEEGTPKRAAQLAYLNTMKQSAAFLGDALAINETPLERCVSEPEGLVCKSQTEQAIGALCSQNCTLAKGQSSPLKMSCDWD